MQQEKKTLDEILEIRLGRLDPDGRVCRIEMDILDRAMDSLPRDVTMGRNPLEDSSPQEFCLHISFGEDDLMEWDKDQDTDNSATERKQGRTNGNLQ